MSKKLTYDEVKEFIELKEYKLISDTYVNANQKILIMCKCGYKYEVVFASFKSGRRCPRCSKKERYSYEFVKEYFEKEGCELLETEYINNHTHMKYICKNKHIIYTTFNKFKSGYRCRICWDEYNTGENHVSWNPNKNEMNLYRRIRKKLSKNYINLYMKDDLNYNNYLLKEKKYHIDHIIPVQCFVKLTTEFKLNEIDIKKIINQRNNLQLLTEYENMSKGAKGSIFEAAQYLMLNGIKLT